MHRRTAKPRTGDPALDQSILDLVSSFGLPDNEDLVTEMVSTVLKIGRENPDRGDIKIVNTALRELRRSYSVFAPFRDSPKCSIFGSARVAIDDPAYLKAQEMGAALARDGWMIITGGGPGIMTAGIRGAGPENSFGITIRLPFESAISNADLPADRLVNFRYFFTRKLTFMKESSAYVIFPGGFGTLDETFELLTLMQTGKEYPAPIILFEPEGDDYWKVWEGLVQDELMDAGLVSDHDLSLVHVVSDVEEACAYIYDFYSGYHSMRYVDGALVLRLQREISDDDLAKLNIDFQDILVGGQIERTRALQQEVEDDDFIEQPRLILDFDNRSFARLHNLIRAL